MKMNNQKKKKKMKLRMKQRMKKKAKQERKPIQLLAKDKIILEQSA